MVSLAVLAGVGALQLVLLALLIGAHYPGGGPLRIACAAGAALVVLTAAMLYAVVLLPTERRWQAMVLEAEGRRERFAAVFDDSLDAMALYYPDGTISRGNAAAQALLGVSDECIGESWRTHVAERDRAMVATCFARALAGEASEFEAVFVDRRGGEIPVLCSLVPIRVRGHVRSVLGMASDQRDLLRVQNEVTDAMDRLRSIIDYHPEAILAIGLDERIERANDAALALGGYRLEELIGRPLAEFAPMHEQLDRRGLGAPMVSEQSGVSVGTLVRKGEPSIPVEIARVPIFVRGELAGTYVKLSDVSERQRLEFKESTQRQRLAAVADVLSRYAGSANEQIARVLDFARHSLGADSGAVSLIEHGRLRIIHATGQALVGGDEFALERTYARWTYGSERVLAISDTHDPQWRNDPATLEQGWRSYIGATLFAEGAPVGIVSFTTRRERGAPFDRSDEDFLRIVAGVVGASIERAKTEAELSVKAFSDDVSGLPNRKYFEDHLQIAMARARRHGGCVTVHYVDLDGFKGVNDTFGHAAGDEVLRVVAARLRGVLRDDDVVARIGGDEFVVLQGACQDDAAAVRLGERLVEAASEPILLGGSRIAVGASVGIAAYPRDADDAEELVRRADAAMYAAKSAGKGRSVLYRVL
ncbi:MAG: diguanylate cyclase [bacterium]|nr:diguanylate cyclase [bacterium]